MFFVWTAILKNCVQEYVQDVIKKKKQQRSVKSVAWNSLEELNFFVMMPYRHQYCIKHNLQKCFSSETQNPWIILHLQTLPHCYGWPGAMLSWGICPWWGFLKLVGYGCSLSDIPKGSCDDGGQESGNLTQIWDTRALTWCCWSSPLVTWGSGCCQAILDDLPLQ